MSSGKVSRNSIHKVILANPHAFLSAWLTYINICNLHNIPVKYWCLGFPGGASGKEPACQRRRH